MSTLLLFLFSLAEAAAFTCFFYAFGLARRSRGRGALITLAGAAVYTALLLLVRLRSHTWYHGALHLLTTAALTWRLTGRRAADCAYLAVVTDGATRFLEHIIGNLCVTWVNSVLFLNDGPWPLRLSADGVIFVTYCLSLLGIGRLLRLDRFTGVSPRVGALLTAFYIVLVALNDLTVRLMQLTQLGSSQVLSLTIIEAAWYVMCVIMLAGANAMSQLMRKREKLMGMEATMRLQNQQYASKKESAEQIARLQHDMRKHLQAVGAISDARTRQDYVDRLTRELRALKKPCHTGNEALDVIAQDRMSQCEKRGIRLLLLVDGALLQFMELPDVVALFANALDNAMEAAAKLSDETRREITVRLSPVRGWLVLRFENQYQGPLALTGGRLKSTKDEPGLHGYGLRSIEYTVRKYGGGVSYTAKDQRFALTCVFPMQENEAKRP